jgi:PKD repeat protein
MKQTLRNLIVFIVALLPALRASSQCANDNSLVAGNLTPPGVSLSTSQTYNAGQYMLAFVESGASYTISTCGGSSFDTQLTVYNDLNGAFVAYNDDFCGLQSTVSFTPTFCGYVRVLLDQYFCNASGLTTTVVMTQNSAGTANPTITSAPDQTACNGNTTTIGISGNGSGGTPPYTYNWTPATNLSSTTVSQPTATVTATQTYTMTITDANGCFTRDTVQVSVLPAPSVNLGPDTIQCGGSISIDAGNPGSTYLWSTGAGSQTISVTQTGNYSVVVQAPSGCINSDDINVVINPLPTVSLGPDTSTCANAVTLDAGGGFSSYAWSTGGSAQNELITTSDTVSVIISDVNGCLGYDTTIVTLNPPPSVNLGADTTRCGGSVTLDAGNPGSLYFWSNFTSSQTTTVSSSGTYAVEVITPAGCINTDTINVIINNQPDANLGPDTAICGSSVTLDAGNPGSSYSWSNSATTQLVTVGNGTYTVTVTDPSGCFDSDTITVTTNAAPVISAGQDQTICVPNSATLTASGGLYYIWSNNATTPSISVSPTTTTTYYVTGFDINGCSASDVVLVTVLPASNAQFTASVVGATGVFTNQSTNAVTYSWDFGDGSPVNNTANPTHTYTVNGTYTVTLTVTGPCGSDTYTQVITISQVGLQDADLSNSLSLFPNPNDGKFTLSFDFTKAKDVTIQVLDVTGRIVYSDEQKGITSYNKQVGLENAESGMYSVRIITTEGVVTEKIVVQH